MKETACKEQVEEKEPAGESKWKYRISRRNGWNEGSPGKRRVAGRMNAAERPSQGSVSDVPGLGEG